MADTLGLGPSAARCESSSLSWRTIQKSAGSFQTLPVRFTVHCSCSEEQRYPNFAFLAQR
jgi:hypothetical protein